MVILSRHFRYSRGGKPSNKDVSKCLSGIISYPNTKELEIVDVLQIIIALLKRHTMPQLTAFTIRGGIVYCDNAECYEG